MNAPVSESKMIQIPLDKVVASAEFNARSGDLRAGDGNEDLHEFAQLKESLRAQGQIDPVIVRPGKDGKYHLVAGFRRHAALTDIANEDKVKDPTILATVGDLSDQKAFEINALENLARENLSPPDVAFAVARIRDSGKKDFAGENQRKLAARIGLSFPYVQRLLYIADHLEKDLFHLWRNGQRAKKSVNDVLEIAKMKPADQKKAWQGEVTPGSGEEKPKGKRAKLAEKAKKEAVKVAEVLGMLEYNGHIKCKGLLVYTEPGDNGKAVLPDGNTPAVYLLTSVGADKLKRAQWLSIAKAAGEAHDIAMRTGGKAEDSEDEDEDEDEDE